MMEIISNGFPTVHGLLVWFCLLDLESFVFVIICCSLLFYWFIMLLTFQFCVGFMTFLIVASRLPEAMDTERLKWKDQPGSIEGAACSAKHCAARRSCSLSRAFPCISQFPNSQNSSALLSRTLPKTQNIPKAKYDFRWLQYFCSCAREPLQLFFEAGLAAGTRLSGSAQAQHSVGNEWKWMGNVWWFWCILLSEFKRIWLQTSANQKVSSKMTVKIYMCIYIYGDNYYITF